MRQYGFERKKKKKKGRRYKENGKVTETRRKKEYETVKSIKRK